MGDLGGLGDLSGPIDISSLGTLSTLSKLPRVYKLGLYGVCKINPTTQVTCLEHTWNRASVRQAL